MCGADSPEARGDQQRDAACERAHSPLPVNGCAPCYLRCCAYIYRTDGVRGAGTDARAVGDADVVDDQERRVAAGDAAGFQPGPEPERAIEAGMQIAQVVRVGG